MFPFMNLIGSMINLYSLFLTLLLSTTRLFGAQIHERALICGVCRNVESRLEKTKSIMESIGNLFEDYRILVYENNSTDKTPQILLSWANNNLKVKVTVDHLSATDCAQIFIHTHADGSFFVPEQIARARNIILDMALCKDYEEFPYLIWMDMDFVLEPNLDGFIDTFYSNENWDAVFAYGVDPQNMFWDWYAFRDKNYPIGSELLGMYWWYMPKQLSLCPGDAWYPVYSAFGGCGIYKKSSINNCRYSAIVTQDLETHAKQLIENGIQTFHPQVITYTKFCNQLDEIYTIEKPMTNLPSTFNLNTGIVLHDNPGALVWRLSSFVYQYPSVCEHVPFHASMIVNGHGNLFINPRLVFRYGD